MPIATKAPFPPVEELLNVDEAAQLVKLKPSTLYSHTSKRRIPHIKRGGRLYFLREDLLAWLLEGRRPVIDERSAFEHVAKLRGAK